MSRSLVAVVVVSMVVLVGKIISGLSRNRQRKATKGVVVNAGHVGEKPRRKRSSRWARPPKLGRMVS